MKILLVHNHYRQSGGEDVVFENEKKLLEAHGHQVVAYQRHNDEADALTQSLWSTKTARELTALIEQNRPQIAHFHNIFFAISPSAYVACRRAGVPIVQTLHNFRLICPGALLLRTGKPCEDCLAHFTRYPGIYHGCWRGSRPGTAFVALFSMLQLKQHAVSFYIALSKFARQKFIEGGLPASKIVVKPNFIVNPQRSKTDPGNYALFVGRLSEEKGLQTLLQAWQNNSLPLRIIGDGPLAPLVHQHIKSQTTPSTVFLGRLPHTQVIEQLQNARFLIIPSICYENFPIILLEAFALGVPVITSQLGSLGELIQNNKTGLHFVPGNAADLIEKSEWLWTHPIEAQQIGQNARTVYQQHYTPEENYRQLQAIYTQVLEST